MAYEEWHKRRSIATKHSPPNIHMATATKVVAVKKTLENHGADSVLLMVLILALLKSKDFPSYLSRCTLLIKA
jgi:hypothetical protein